MISQICVAVASPLFHLSGGRVRLHAGLSFFNQLISCSVNSFAKSNKQTKWEEIKYMQVTAS